MNTGRLHVSDSVPLEVILIGPRSAGKSATINTIIGENLARSTSGLSSESTTKNITKYPVKDLNITLVDTPALKESVVRKLNRTLTGSDVIGFVIPAQRIQEEEISCVRIFLKTFKDFLPRSLIILTRGNNYRADDFDWEAIEELFNLYKAVEQRIVVFENKFETQQKRTDQIEKFLSTINKCKALPRLSSVDKFVKLKSAVAFHVVACIEESCKLIFQTGIETIGRIFIDISECANALRKSVFSTAPLVKPVKKAFLNTVVLIPPFIIVPVIASSVIMMSCYHSILWTYFQPDSCFINYIS